VMVNSKLVVPFGGTVKEGVEKLAVASASTFACTVGSTSSARSFQG